MKSKKSIGLLGGSFNPVHNGHIAIANSFLQSKNIDELWILLTPESPHKQDEKLANYEHRLNMLRLAFQNMEKVSVSDFEQSLPTPSYTVQTITSLKKEHPDHRFYLCMGQDALATFNTWYKWREIIKEVNLLVASRPDHTIADLDQSLRDKAHFIDHKQIDNSSSEIREKIATRVDVNHLIPDSVLQYIKKHNLYTA